MSGEVISRYDDLTNLVEWEPDSASSNCRRCYRSWNIIFVRRHHCRCCGALICDECSAFEVVNHESTLLERVCYPCNTLINAIQLELYHIHTFYDQMEEKAARTPSDVISHTDHKSELETKYCQNNARSHDHITPEKVRPVTSQYVTLASPRKFPTKLVFNSSSLADAQIYGECEEEPEVTVPEMVDLDEVLTPQALQLQNSMDEMSDVQLEKLFKKLSASKALSGIDLEDIQNYPEVVFQEILSNPHDYIT